jgi:hypothetical protein
MMNVRSLLTSTAAAVSEVWQHRRNNNAQFHQRRLFKALLLSLSPLLNVGWELSSTIRGIDDEGASWSILAIDQSGGPRFRIWRSANSQMVQARIYASGRCVQAMMKSCPFTPGTFAGEILGILGLPSDQEFLEVM